MGDEAADTPTPKKRRQGVRPTERDRATIERAFLDALTKRGNVAAACRAARIHRDTAYEWRKSSPAFAASWDSALESGVDHLEDVAWKRAAKESDTLLIFLLKANRPDKYREMVHQEVSGGVTVRVSYVNDWRMSANGEGDRTAKGLESLVLIAASDESEAGH